MELYINATGQPNQQSSKVLVTITGTAQEFQSFMQALERACSAPMGTACTFDAATSTGVPLRFVVDRNGPPVPAQGRTDDLRIAREVKRRVS